MKPRWYLSFARSAGYNSCFRCYQAAREVALARTLFLTHQCDGL